MPGLQERVADSADSQDMEPSAEAPPRPFLNEYLPTAEEISQACREIQAGWSPAERRRRRGYRRAHHRASLLRVVKVAFAG